MHVVLCKSGNLKYYIKKYCFQYRYFIQCFKYFSSVPSINRSVYEYDNVFISIVIIARGLLTTIQTNTYEIFLL